MMADIDRFFWTTYKDILCNTSYPYRPEYFGDYRSEEDIMADVTDMSVYMHIPFCRSLCRFCEYTRVQSGNLRQEQAYVDLLEKQVEQFFENHRLNKLYGLDIGGGTPTALSDAHFEKVLEIASGIRNRAKTAEDFEASAEFSFSTVSRNKIRMLAEHDIHRVSAGIQVSDRGILKENNREIPGFDRIAETKNLLKDYGIGKLNLDVMYGLAHQTSELCMDTMRLIEELHPEQVTLYETRYNMNRLGHDGITRELLYEQYDRMYDQLMKMGYYGRFGQNAFSLSESDEGVSSYLRYRMNQGTAYKGFGVSAQSMSRQGISYNCLKSAQNMDFTNMDSLWVQDNYHLPPDEIAAKYISISLYSGRFDMKIGSEILNKDFEEHFKEEMAYLKEKRLIEIRDDRCYLTSEGFLHYGAVAAMFWSEHHKKKYLEDNYADI